MDFLEELKGLLEQVPPGRVTTFKALAGALGDASAAKGVSTVLHEFHPDGWHRVVRSDGRLSAPEVHERLAAEGVPLEAESVRHLAEQVFDQFTGGGLLSRLRAEQVAMAQRLVLDDDLEVGGPIAGVDVSYRGHEAFGAAVLLDPDSGEVREIGRVRETVRFPYVATYLGFRELDVMRACVQRLRDAPSVLLVDGHGTLHPVGCGLACMVGLRLNQPTVGVAKRPLGGGTPTLSPGRSHAIRDRGRTRGYAFRPPTGRPIYVSPGHRISPDTALGLVGPLCRHRLPEPLRQAHLEATRQRRAASE